MPETHIFSSIPTSKLYFNYFKAYCALIKHRTSFRVLKSQYSTPRRLFRILRHTRCPNIQIQHLTIYNQTLFLLDAPIISFTSASIQSFSRSAYHCVCMAYPQAPHEAHYETPSLSNSQIAPSTVWQHRNPIGWPVVVITRNSNRTT